MTKKYICDKIKFILMKFLYKIKGILFFLIFFHSGFLFSQENNRTVITIDNANSTRYEKDKDTGNDCIILSGNVKLTVEKGSNKNVISAESIKFDRTSDMLYAEGSVHLEQTTSTSGSQSVTASSLMFNASTLEGVFDDGRVVQTQSDAINLPSGSTLIVASDIFGRSQSNTIAFKDGVLTFCNDINPHWNIKASKIWLLPGGEFSFFNALLFVGPVPVIYLPAFYYPKDELIFNPVFGIDQRQGYFIQTTTYLYGRKPLDTSSNSSSSDGDGTEKLKALFNFIRPSTLKEQKLEGLVLHNLDTNYSGNTTDYLKLLGDYYSNLGWLVGLEGVFKPKAVFSSVEFSTRVGFTDTVFRNGAKYSPFSPSGVKYYDKSNLLGIKLPFRYGISLKLALTKPFTLNLNVPLYSDPYFNDDFSTRNETMDWIGFLTSSVDQSTEERTINEVSSFNWALSGSYTIPLPKVIKPYLNSASISFNSSVAFSSYTTQTLDTEEIQTQDVSAWKTYSPNRKFYYPSQITPVNISATISGTIFSWPLQNSSNQVSNAPSFSPALIVPDDLKSEKQKEESKKSEEEKETFLENENPEGVAQESENSFKENKLSNEEQKEGIDLILKDALPSLNVPSNSVKTFSDVTFSSKYSIKPAFTSQLAYSTANLSSPEDFHWEEIRSSSYTVKVPVSLDNSFSYGGSFLSLSNNFTFSPVWQAHPYISTDTTESKIGYTKSEIDSLNKTDYAATKKDLTTTNSISFKPFYYIDSIKDIGITYRNVIKMVRTNFIGDAENPQWEYLTTDWSDPDSITTNSLDFTLAFNQMDNKFSQSLTLTTTLKPQVENYYGTLKFTFPYTTCQFEAGIKRKSVTDDTWVKQPFKQNLTFSIFNNTLKLSESYNYNLDEDHHDSLKIALSWQSLQAAYTMSYTNGYDFDNDSGWISKTDKEFLPYSFSLAYAPSSVTLYAWKNRISLSLGVNTSIVADLLRPTNSYFTFSPSITLKINEFLNLSFSATSKNQVIYRYFSREIDIPGEKNIFLDFINSFRFDDENLRKASGFKLKSLKFDITHELHDWDFKTSFKFEPRIKTENGHQYYDFNPYMTISISWRPMGSFKTEIVDDYGTWQLK